MIIHRSTLSSGLEIRDLDADGLTIDAGDGHDVWISHEDLHEVSRFSAFLVPEAVASANKHGEDA